MTSFVRGLSRVMAVIGVVVLLLVALVVGAVWLTIPSTQQTTTMPSLLAAVDITYDADWVPRIKAGSEADAAAALGFLHARDRMFQMELMRRSASGRLSEIVGTATLPLDRMMRTLGLRHHAIADLRAAGGDKGDAGGIRARRECLDRAERPLCGAEFLLLGAPEPWQPTDSLLWAKTMGLWLSMNWRQELIARLWLGVFPLR